MWPPGASSSPLLARSFEDGLVTLGAGNGEVNEVCPAPIRASSLLGTTDNPSDISDTTVSFSLLKSQNLCRALLPEQIGPKAFRWAWHSVCASEGNGDL